MKKLLYFLPLLFFACNTDQQVDQEDLSAEEKNLPVEDSLIEPTYPFDEKYNEFAMYISGIQPFDSIAPESFWQEYSDQLATIWNKTNEKLPVMRDWTTQELADANAGGGTLFYPFSGPDYLHADVFFPSYDTIVMIGLEPIGSFPDLKNEEDSTVENYLNGVRQSLHALLGLSFFRTVAMAKDFKGDIDGTLPVLMHFMNRTGYTVMYQEKVMVTEDGQLTTDLTEETKEAYIGNRYYFRKDDQVKVLCYFSVNLQNMAYATSPGLDSRTDFINYLNNLNFKATYLKSASFLMHRPTFSTIRDIILNNSTYVLQDNSGIPVAEFDRDVWDLKFYGTYTKPISLFRERHQEDLKRIYQGDSIDTYPLPFGIGYHYRKGTSNLMLATRK